MAPTLVSPGRTQRSNAEGWTQVRKVDFDALKEAAHLQQQPPPPRDGHGSDAFFSGGDDDDYGDLSSAYGGSRTTTNVTVASVGGHDAYAAAADRPPTTTARKARTAATSKYLQAMQDTVVPGMATELHLVEPGARDLAVVGVAVELLPDSARPSGEGGAAGTGAAGGGFDPEPSRPVRSGSKSYVPAATLARLRRASVSGGGSRSPSPSLLAATHASPTGSGLARVTEATGDGSSEFLEVGGNVFAVHTIDDDDDDGASAEASSSLNDSTISIPSDAMFDDGGAAHGDYPLRSMSAFSMASIPLEERVDGPSVLLSTDRLVLRVGSEGVARNVIKMTNNGSTVRGLCGRMSWDVVGCR